MAGMVIYWGSNKEYNDSRRILYYNQTTFQKGALPNDTQRIDLCKDGSG